GGRGIGGPEGRPRRAPGGAVRRHGPDRHPAPRGALRARPRRRHRRTQGQARRQAARPAAEGGPRLSRESMTRLALLVLLLASFRAIAGNQIYEPLADSVRERLSAMVSDRAPAQLHFRSPEDGQRWIDAMDKRLAGRMPDRQSRMELLRAVHYEALRARLDPQLV